MQFVKALTFGILVSTLAATSAQATGRFHGGDGLPDFRQILQEIRERDIPRIPHFQPPRDFRPIILGSLPRHFNNPRFCPPKDHKNVPELDGGSAGIALGLVLSLIAMRRERKGVARKQTS